MKRDGDELQRVDLLFSVPSRRMHRWSLPTVLVATALVSVVVHLGGHALHATVSSEEPVVAEWASPLGSKPLDGKLESIEGEKIRLSKLRGEPLFLELWATWCLPCRAQAKVVDSLSEDFSRLGVQVLSVNEGEERSLVESFLADTPSKYPVVLDRWQVVANQLQAEQLPTLVLLDAEGVVVALRVGMTSREDVLEMLEALPE